MSFSYAGSMHCRTQKPRLKNVAASVGVYYSLLMMMKGSVRIHKPLGEASILIYSFGRKGAMTAKIAPRRPPAWFIGAVQLLVHFRGLCSFAVRFFGVGDPTRIAKEADQTTHTSTSCHISYDFVANEHLEWSNQIVLTDYVASCAYCCWCCPLCRSWQQCRCVLLERRGDLAPRNLGVRLLLNARTEEPIHF